jgi:hypothetical protein
MEVRKEQPRLITNDVTLVEIRDVVTPPVFEMNGRVNFREYLNTFEDYFAKKFNGSEYDQTQELAKFLNGDLLQVYKIRGGRTLKYKEMKKQLLQFYKKQKVGSTSFWKKELSHAFPEPDEKLDIYGMRLIELAKFAYPKSSSDSARQLRKHFLETIPSAMTTKIADAERTLRATTSSKAKYLKFSSIMQMATDLQKENKQSKTVMWTTKTDSPPQNTNYNYGPQSFNVQQHTSNSKPQHPQINSFQQSASHNSPGCSYCKKPNHIKKDCWRASNSCLICGQGHHLEKCPRYDPNYRSKSQKQQDNKPLN